MVWYGVGVGVPADTVGDGVSEGGEAAVGDADDVLAGTETGDTAGVAVGADVAAGEVAGEEVTAGEVAAGVAATVAAGVSVGVSVGVAGRASGEVGTSLAWLAGPGVGEGNRDEGARTGLAGAGAGAEGHRPQVAAQ